MKSSKSKTQNLNSDQQFIKKIKLIKRSPKLGRVYEIYREEQQATLCNTTLTRQNKIWLKHLSIIEEHRIDRLEPLFIQKKILKPIFIEELTVLPVAISSRIRAKIMTFASTAIPILKMIPAIPGSVSVISNKCNVAITRQV